jgi:hypothetical protein
VPLAFSPTIFINRRHIDKQVFLLTNDADAAFFRPTHNRSRVLQPQHFSSFG